MIEVLCRSVEIFLVLLAVTRCMGKREIGSLQPFEFVLSMMLANLATAPLADPGIPLWEGILPLLVMLVLQVLFSLFSMKSARFQALVCGQPALVIHHGTVNEELLESLRYSTSDLLTQIRSAGYTGPQEVEYAVLETNGVLNIIPKPDHAALTRADMALPQTRAALPYTLIEDGQVMQDALDALGKDRAWLDERLHAEGCSSPAQVLYALYLPNQKIALQKRRSVSQHRRIRP